MSWATAEQTAKALDRWISRAPARSAKRAAFPVPSTLTRLAWQA
ncbi:hypothetical protein [Streptomyces huiliensis]|nr:hypothetical protein [Streptomyces huiliensis]